MATFFLTDLQIHFKIYLVQAIYDMNKLCLFHKNLTTNTDFIA